MVSAFGPSIPSILGIPQDALHQPAERVHGGKEAGEGEVRAAPVPPRDVRGLEARQQVELFVVGPAEHVQRVRGGPFGALSLDGEACLVTVPLPFLEADRPVPIAIEPAPKLVLVLLPLREQRADGVFCHTVSGPAHRAEAAQRIDLFVHVYAFLEVAIVAAVGPEARLSRGAGRPGRGAVPGGRFRREHLCVRRLHYALAGPVVDEERLAGPAARDGLPALAPATPACGFAPVLHAVAPPDAVALCHRCEICGAGKWPGAALELDVALRRRAHPRRRRVLDYASHVHPSEGEPAPTDHSGAEVESPEPGVRQISQRADPGPRLAAAPR